MAIAENLSHRVTRRELFGMVKKYAEDTSLAVGIAGEIAAISGFSKWGWEMSQADKLRSQVPSSFVIIPHPKNPDFTIPEKKYYPQNQDHQLILNKANSVEKKSGIWAKIGAIGGITMTPGIGIISKRIINNLEELQKEK